MVYGCVLRTHNPQGDNMNNKYTRIEKIRHFAEKIARAIPEGQNLELDNALGAIEYLTSERFIDNEAKTQGKKLVEKAVARKKEKSKAS